MLDKDEVRDVAEHMGLGEQIVNPEFVSSMLKEMEAGRFLKADGKPSPRLSIAGMFY